MKIEKQETKLYITLTLNEMASCKTQEEINTLAKTKLELELIDLLGSDYSYYSNTKVKKLNTLKNNDSPDTIIEANIEINPIQEHITELFLSAERLTTGM